MRPFRLICVCRLLTRECPSAIERRSIFPVLVIFILLLTLFLAIEMTNKENTTLLLCIMQAESRSGYFFAICAIKPFPANLGSKVILCGVRIIPKNSRSF